MPLLDDPSQQPAERDDLDDLFNQDLSMDDVFKDTNTNDSTLNGQPDPKRRNNDSGTGLGIDEEIKVTKRRQPIAKLDEARLLSSAGVPRLRKITKERLKFRGKGHEFSDISRLLNVYQLWLDDLYPRAKFADGLAIIEKLGHKKTIQMKRKEWVDESKPRPQYEGTPEPTEEPNRDSSNVSQQGDTIDSGPNAQETLQDQEQIQDPDQVNTAESEQPISTEAAGDEMDDLDALLAEDAMTLGGQEPGLKGRSLPLRDDFDDEMEAMAGLDNPW